MAKNIWDDATGVTYNQVQAGKIKKPGAPGKTEVSVIAAPPVTPIRQQLNAALGTPAMPQASAKVTVNEGGFNRTFNPATDSPDNVGRARAANIEAAKQGMVSTPAPVPAMETPQGIATNMAMNPTPAVAPQTIMDIPRPLNQPQVQRATPAPAPVEQPMPAAADPFAYRGGYPEGSPKGPSNGPDSTALNPGQAPVVAPAPVPAMSAEEAAIRAKHDAVMNGKQEAADPALLARLNNNVPPVVDKIGHEKGGMITAESAQAAMGNPMTRSGGIAGSYDGKGVNDILARENKIRGEMIDSMIAANGGNGIALMPDRTNEDNEKLQAMKLSPQEYLAYMLAKGKQESSVNDAEAKNSIAMRGQDLSAQTEAARLAGNPVDNQIKQNQVSAGQMTNDSAKQVMGLQAAYQAEKDPAKRAMIAENIRALSGKDAASKFLTVQGGEFTDPDNPMVKMKSPSSIFDTSTRQFIPQPGQQNQAAGQVNKTAGGPVAPKVNEVRGGHRYIGGNPADPKSWEKA